MHNTDNAGPANGDSAAEDVELFDEPVTNSYLNPIVTASVEVASINMTVREWSLMRVGQAIPTGDMLGASANLVADGVVVASGRLVSLAGELCLQIERVLR